MAANNGNGNGVVSPNSLLPSPVGCSNQDNKDSLYAELWQACAGPSVTVPRLGDKVYYFPQGHLEQVELYTKEQTISQIPKYDIPSRILCSVVHVDLMAELDTDQVFAHLILLPQEEQQDSITENQTPQTPPQKDRVRTYKFCKTLTASDTSTHGGFSLLKRHADESLPPLDMSQQTPTQELVTKDLHGFEWRFRHIYRGQPKRHLLTTGWSTFVSTKKLVAGDAFIFLRGENGELRVGVRRAIKPRNNAAPSVISNQSMQLGVLASAAHAISSGSMFSVYIRPRPTSEFIVPYAQYVKSGEVNYARGMRFKMKFESEEFPDRSLAGTVVSVEDLDPLRWPGSEWRCLVVRWDETSATVTHPARVSPWNIEPLSVPSKNQTSHLPQPKRAHIQNLSLLNDDTIKRSPQVQRQQGVLQGQDNNSSTCVHGLGKRKPSLAHLVLPPGFSWHQTTAEQENEWHCHMHDIFSSYARNLTPTSNIFPDVLGNQSYCFSPVSIFGTDGENEFHDKSNPNATPSQPKRSGTCKVFGVDLVRNPQDLEPLPSSVKTSTELSDCSGIAPLTPQLATAIPVKRFELSEMESFDYNGSGSRSEEMLKTNSFTTRSCTKVRKYGAALGRSVDVTRYSEYSALVSELDQMFDFGGALMDLSSGWSVVYTDEEGNNKLIGDCPWQTFQAVVQKIYIWPEEEVDTLTRWKSNTRVM